MGKAITTPIKAVESLALSPGRIGGPVNENNPNILGNLAKSMGLGALLGGTYHGLKRTFYNTKQENEEEDQQGNTMLRDMAYPALAMGALNYAERSALPGYYNALAKGEKPSIISS